MQIVINIDDDIYKRALVYKDVQLAGNIANDLSELTTAVANGIPLQKGHGRLVDADKLKERCLFMSNDDTAIEGMEYVTKGMIENAHAVIKADKEAEDETK